MILCKKSFLLLRAENIKILLRNKQNDDNTKIPYQFQFTFKTTYYRTRSRILKKKKKIKIRLYVLRWLPVLMWNEEKENGQLSSWETVRLAKRNLVCREGSPLFRETNLCRSHNFRYSTRLEEYARASCLCSRAHVLAKSDTFLPSQGFRNAGCWEHGSLCVFTTSRCAVSIDRTNESFYSVTIEKAPTDL